ncbi:protein of unknown function [Ralstonia solanacearum CMR15]|nr:protein of unknown function [Ralstonia solanacearum CMR15]
MQLDVEVLRIAARHEGLVNARDLLEVRAGIRRQRRRPVSPRHRVETVPAVGAMVLVAEIQVLAVAHVEQVVQAQRVVDADAQVALQLAGRAGARIVHRRDDRPGLRALDRDHHIAHARHVRRHELHVDVLAGDALHLLQALFEVAQVQQVTWARGEGGFPGAPHIGLCETDLPDHAGHQDEAQRAGAQVLLGQQHARGHVASAQDGLRDTLGEHVHALLADAGAVVVVKPCLGEGEGVLGQSGGALGAGGLGQVLRDFQGETVDAEAGCFGGDVGELGRGGLLGAYCGGLYGLFAFAGLLLLAEALFLFRVGGCGGGRLGGGCLGEDVGWKRRHQETDRA